MRHFEYKQILLLIAFVILLAACQGNPETNRPEQEQKKDTLPPKKYPDHSVEGSFSTQTLLHFDSNAINPFIRKYPLFNPFLKDIRRFYRSRHFDYAWYDQKGLIEQADNLYNHLLNVHQEGAVPPISYPDSLANVLENNPGVPDPESELLLTAHYFSYAKTVWGGLPEKETQAMEWFLPRKKLNLPKLLDSLLKEPDLFGKGYANRQYDLLKNELRKYRILDSLKKFTPLVAHQKSYKKSDHGSFVLALRSRLFDLGDLPADSHSPVFDEELMQGVESFQTRNGFKPDGIAGAGTIRRLNKPFSEIARMILLNMERSRWVPVSLSGNYFIINIPAFELFAYENDSLVFTMKVVVGKSVHKTVIFNGDLKYVVFSPYWNVPPGILKNEVLPGIRKDPNYLARNNMEWNGKSVRQKPGPKNSLGLVKFLFPNSYNIYLHDSPAKSLFNEDTRAFSHGCIRLAEPRKMAIYLLRNMPEWTEAKIDAAMHKGKEQYVTLKDPVQVYIAYLTAWVSRNGKLNLRDDIYKRDDRLASMLLNSAK